MTSRVFKPLYTAIFLLIMVSCDSESPDPQTEWGTFELSIKQNLSGDPNMKVAAQDITQLVVTITKTDGTATDFTQTKLNVYLSGDVFISEKILLPIGDYLITSAYLITEDNVVVSASPQQDSPLAQGINGSLPIFFNVANEGPENQPAIIEIEAISTRGLTPADFGLDVSTITFKELTHIYIGLVKNVGELEYLPGHLTITSGDYIYKQELKEGINTISFSPRYASYHVKAESPGRRAYEHTYTLSALKAHEINPMLVVLRD